MKRNLCQRVMGSMYHLFGIKRLYVRWNVLDAQLDWIPQAARGALIIQR